MNLREIRQAIRDKYAWPGGYPLHLVMSDGEAFCIGCARSNWRQICRDTRTMRRHGRAYSGWEAVDYAVNWEDPCLTCAHCGERIESAYNLEDEA